MVSGSITFAINRSILVRTPQKSCRSRPFSEGSVPAGSDFSGTLGIPEGGRTTIIARDILTLHIGGSATTCILGQCNQDIKACKLREHWLCVQSLVCTPQDLLSILLLKYEQITISLATRITNVKRYLQHIVSTAAVEQLALMAGVPALNNLGGAGSDSKYVSL